MTLEALVKQFKRNGWAYVERGNEAESRGWFRAAELLEEYIKENKVDDR